MLSMLACIAAHDDVGCLDHPLLTTPHPLVLLPPHPTHPPGGPPGPLTLYTGGVGAQGEYVHS